MRKFKTESKKLLDLMINSIYTNKEIFLRELISNASDAVDKLYFKSLVDTGVGLGEDALHIQIGFDKDMRTITISDNGIGMTKEELETNLGTIAHSGSAEFKIANVKDDEDDLDIIGRFGVGFYSAFMVADKVKVVSRAYGSDEAYAWESQGAEGYTIAESERATRGTDIILSLKQDTEDDRYSTFLSEHHLKNLIRKYSNYVRYPIRMQCKKSRELPEPDDAGDDYQPVFEEYLEFETVNSMIPIWKRKKSDVSDEEYNEFYKNDFHDFVDPLRAVSVHAEGSLSYDALLYIPGRQPYDLYNKDYKKGLALYSSGVLIMEKCEDLLPDHFGFVRGVVDSQDLSLNISREILQQTKQLKAIARKIEKKIKSELVDMRDNNRETYEGFFGDFGRVLKYGIYSGYGMQKDELAELLLFYSARQQKMVTLDEYLDMMIEGQESILYAAGDSIDLLAKTPVVTSVLDKGYDVLLCTQEVDDFCMMAMGDYNGKELKNVTGMNLGLESEEEKNKADEIGKENEELFAVMKDTLGDKVTKVVVSTRLTDAPVCITAEGPISLGMEKVLAAMSDEGQIKSQRVFEINAQHPIFDTLQSAKAVGDDDKVALYTDVLYNQALLVEGLPIEDPISYAQAVCALMK